MGLVTEVKKEDIFKRETKVSSPWSDPNFNKIDDLGGEPGFKIDDIPERLGLVQEGESLAEESYYSSDLEDMPSGYGIKGQFLQTDGKSELSWAWPFWGKSGSTVYYKSGKVAIGHAAAQTVLHVLTPTASEVRIETSGVSDPILSLKTTNTAHQVNFSLDESATNDDFYIEGKTAGVNTSVHIIAVDGKVAGLKLYSGAANYGALIFSAGDTLNLKNSVQDKDLIFGIKDGAVEKTITWDADVDKLKHSAGLFDFDDDNLLTTGTLGCGTITVADGGDINLQENIIFSGATTVNRIQFPDNVPNALQFSEGEENAYITFTTTNGSEAVVFGVVGRFLNEGLHILDTNASHDLIVKAGSDLTANRILSFVTGDAARTITLSGNPTLADWFDQAVKQASTPTFDDLTISTPANIYALSHNSFADYAADQHLAALDEDNMVSDSDTNVATQQSIKAYVDGASYQPVDAELTAIAGLTSAANRYIRFTGSGTADLRTYANVLADLSGIAGAAFNWNNQNLAGISTLECGAITVVDGNNINLQEALNFTGATTENIISFPDNLPSALLFREGGNQYMAFSSANGSEQIVFNKVFLATTGSVIGNLTFASGSITDSGGAISFGNENLSTTGTIAASTVKLTDLTDGYVPYHVNDATGLANSPIFINGVNVGVGVSPSRKLHVKTATDAHLVVRPGTDWGGAYTGVGVQGLTDALGVAPLLLSGSVVVFADCNVGVGCVPAELFEVSAAGGSVRLTQHGYIEAHQKLDVATAGLNLEGFSNGGGARTSTGAIRIWQTANGRDGGYIRFDVHDGTNPDQEAMRIAEDFSVTVTGCVADGTCEIMKNENAIDIIDDILKTGSGKKDEYNHERMDMKKIHGKYPFMIHEQIGKYGKKTYFDKLGAKSDLIYVAIGQLKEKIEVLEASL